MFRCIGLHASRRRNLRAIVLVGIHCVASVSHADEGSSGEGTESRESDESIESSMPAEGEREPEDEAQALEVSGDRPQRSNLAGLDSSLATQTLALPTGEDKSGVTSQALSLPTGEGSIQGMDESFSAQLSTGVANFSVPLQLPKARGEVQTELTLSYSSASGQGVAGQGFSLGVPFISRQTDRGIPNYDDAATFHPDQDRFVFNGGQELIPICVVQGASCDGALSGEAMPVWANRWMYFRARVEGAFQRFFWSPDHRTWRVQSKSGASMEFGVPLDGSGNTAALEVNPEEESEIFGWHLVRQYDSWGEPNLPSGEPLPLNLVVYGYLNDGGTAYLSDIYDTPPRDGDATSALSLWAHHTVLRYEVRPDPIVSYRSGWRRDRRLRLTGVDITSKTFESVSSARRMVRRYHLAYNPRSHISLLDSVQTEGRCVASASPNGTGGEIDAPVEGVGAGPGCGDLPGGVCERLGETSCGRLPAMTFDYTHVPGFQPNGSEDAVALSDGSGFFYEPFDGRVREIENSPPHSLDESLTSLFDVNADGLPDVLVTSPGLYGGGHGVFFNGDGGAVDTFGAAVPMAVEGVLGADAGVLRLTNLNVAPLDLDGDGIINLLHMPRERRYAIYTPARRAGSWHWLGRVVEQASGLNPSIDLGRDASNTQVVDVNFDGLVDVVRSTGTELQTFLSLGRYPGGDGQFGTAEYTSATSAEIVNEPIRTCVPWAGQAVQFADPEVQFADMNGDGIQDIVRLRTGDVLYWPGRGNGYFGIGAREDCPPNHFGEARHIRMNSAPRISDPEHSSLRLDDINGDGLSDLVQIRYDAMDIWLNVDGVGWTEKKTLDGTPFAPSYQDRVRLVDINGSGTRDVLWGDASNYRYIDLQGGRPPRLLHVIENGLGKTTELEFSSSSLAMLSAETQGPCREEEDSWASGWCQRAPVVTQVLNRKIDRHNLPFGSIGAPAYVTEYEYRDPVYEGRQREFRGYARARSIVLGDANSPTSIVEHEFLLGECQDFDPSNGVDCGPEHRWLDNPYEALKGQVVLSETYDESGTYQSTSASHYTLRELYVGLDGRRVMHAFQSEQDTWSYDTAPFHYDAAPFATLSFSLGSPESLHPLLSRAEDSVAREIMVRSSSGTAHTRSEMTLDEFGNPLRSSAFGCVDGDGCEAVDEIISQIQVPELLTADGSGWLWRPARSYVEGSEHPGVLRNDERTTFEEHGAAVEIVRALSGTVPLARTQAVSAPNASQDGLLVVAETSYDARGRVLRSLAALGRCVDTEYDAAYGMMAVTETTYTRGCSNLTASPEGLVLGMQAQLVDQGLGKAVRVLDFNGQPTHAVLDELGRTRELYQPHPGVAGALSPLPSTQIEYDLATSVRRYSIIHTRSQDGASLTEDEFLERLDFIDGFGRSLVSLTEADPTRGDAGQWIAGEANTYDAKGATQQKHMPFFWDGEEPAAFRFPSAWPSAYAQERYDAFGRGLVTYHLDGSVSLQQRHHALCIDAWDGADLASGSHQGTYATECRDGHGRVSRRTERVHVGTELEERHTLTSYLPTGEPEVLRRQRGLDEVVRWMRYDSLGRMVLNVEPNTSAGFTPDLNADASSIQSWRYAYNDANELVGTSDARGCGANYFYDGARRLLGEDYLPCESHHASYTAPSSTPSVNDPTGLEVVYLYDALADETALPFLQAEDESGTAFHSGQFLLGRLVGTFDRGRRVMVEYDGRGRQTGSHVSVTQPEQHENPALPGRYAPRWYHRFMTYDAANREVTATTGAQSPGMQSQGAGESFVESHYSRRGTIHAVSSSYAYGTEPDAGDIVSSIARAADGLVVEMTYADAAHTTTAHDYDDRRRMLHSMTFRGAAQAWPSEALEDGGVPSFQLLLQDEDFEYDAVDNPIAIRDHRIAGEWPSGAAPVTRRMHYDDLYRVRRIDYEYPSGTDSWVDPFEAESNADPSERRLRPNPRVQFAQRTNWQTFDYDWLGNTQSTADDADGFYDRSLGAVTNGQASDGPDQLRTAQLDGERGGQLRTEYDEAGHLIRLHVARQGQCVGGQCSHRFVYDWDEVGRLIRARRYDVAPGAIDFSLTPLAEFDPSGGGAPEPNVELRYAYDAGVKRVLKSTTANPAAGPTETTQTVYVFPSLELRRADWQDGGEGVFDYQLDEDTETVYLIANETRLARVVWAEDDTGQALVPSTGAAGSFEGRQRVFFELGDHLGSPSVVFDKETGELVERSTRLVYGAVDSDYRPERWQSFREDYGFTGKEEDAEVGLQFFGFRYYAPLLRRWISADPLEVHMPGESDANLYAYVKGQALKATDPTGLVGDLHFEGNKITVTVDIVLDGRGATKFAAKRYQKAIVRAWAKNPETGKNWTVKAEVNGQVEEFEVEFKFSVKAAKALSAEELAAAKNDPSTNYIETKLNGEHRSFVSGHSLDRGTWVSWRAADGPHETAHLLGLLDRYLDRPDNQGSVPWNGWEDSILGSTLGKVEQRVIDMVLEKPLERFLRIRGNLKSGTLNLKTQREVITEEEYQQAREEIGCPECLVPGTEQDGQTESE